MAVCKGAVPLSETVTAWVAESATILAVSYQQHKGGKGNWTPTSHQDLHPSFLDY